MWYYIKDGKRIGPISASSIDELIYTGAIDEKTLVWREGLETWTVASDTELNNLILSKQKSPEAIHKSFFNKEIETLKKRGPMPTIVALILFFVILFIVIIVAIYPRKQGDFGIFYLLELPVLIIALSAVVIVLALIGGIIKSLTGRKLRAPQIKNNQKEYKRKWKLTIILIAVTIGVVFLAPRLSSIAESFYSSYFWIGMLLSASVLISLSRSIISLIRSPESDASIFLVVVLSLCSGGLFALLFPILFYLLPHRTAGTGEEQVGLMLWAFGIGFIVSVIALTVNLMEAALHRERYQR